MALIIIIIPGSLVCMNVKLMLEYCSAVWCSAADTHLKLLQLLSLRAINCVRNH